MGKPTSSTLASLAGLFKERDERSVSQAPDAQSGTDERLGDTNEASEKENIISRARVGILIFCFARKYIIAFVDNWSKSSLWCY